MMKRLTLFLIAAGLFSSALLVSWSCSPDGSSFLEANPASPKAVVSASYDPFHGLDEDGHFAGVGDADTYRAYLQIFARRLAVATHDADIRATFGQAGPTSLAKTIDSRPKLLALMADGFVKDIGAANLGGKLIDIISVSDYGDGKAFLSASEALYGLEVTLVDPNGTYRGNTPIEVYHTPVLDEKDTELVEGFDPDGNPVTMPFRPSSFKRSEPFFFINYDEDYFWRPENQTTAMADDLPRLRPTLLAHLDPRNLLVTRAWAHGSHGTPIPDCYHGESIYIARFRFSDAHEGNGTPPEMTFTYTPSFRHFGSPYKSLKSRSRRYEAADEINTDYPKSGQKLPEIYFHAGLDCWGEVFPSGTSGYQREDELNLRWVEEDMWPNPDDKVAHWKNAETYSSGNVYLHETHHTTYGKPQESKTNLTTKPSGRNYYR